MKRLLGLLLVMGMVGCGGPVARLEDKGAKITKNEQGEVVEVHLNRKPIGWKRGQTPHPQISDAGLADIKGLTSLEALNLNSCRQVTDAGLVHLKGLTNLEDLDLGETKVTDAGLAAMQQTLPNCKITK